MTWREQSEDWVDPNVKERIPEVKIVHKFPNETTCEEKGEPSLEKSIRQVSKGEALAVMGYDASLVAVLGLS